MTSEPMTREYLDELVDIDPLRLRDEAFSLLAEAEELRAALVEARRDTHTARIDYNLARTRADKAEAQLTAAWALAEPWQGNRIHPLRHLANEVLSIRDRADLTARPSSPSGEQA